MRNLKLILIFTQIILLPNQIFGQTTCAKLRSNILSLENEQTNSKLNDCKSSEQSNCCRASEPHTCKTLGEMESEYNSLLSKVVLLDSLMALGSIINKDHRLVKNIPLKDLEKSSKKIDNLLYNLDKSKIISLSLESKNKDFFWKGFEQNSFKMSEWISLKCQDETYAKFCSELEQTTKKITNQKHIDDLSQTLLGLANSTQYVLDNDLEKNLKNYQSYLEIKIDDKSVSYDELGTSAQLNKLQRLQSLVKSFKNSRNDDEAKEIVKLTNELKELKVDFSKKYKDDVEPRLAEFSRDNLSDPLVDIKYALDGYAGTSTIKESLSDNQSILTSETNRLKKSLNINVKSFFKESTKTCPSSDYPECLKKHYVNAGNDPERIEIKSFIDQFKTITELGNLSKTNKNAVICLSNPEKNKIECKAKLKERISKLLGKDDLDTLKQKLANQERLIQYAKKGEPIIKNNFTLAYSIKLYKETCNQVSKESTQAFISSCSREVVSKSNYEAIKLGEGLKAIVLNVSRNNYIKDGKILDNSQVELLTQNFKQECLSEEKSSDILCIADKQIDRKNAESQRFSKALEKQSFMLLNTKINNQKEIQKIFEEEKQHRQQAIAGATTLGAMNVLGGLFEFNQIHQSNQMQLQSLNSNLNQMKWWNSYRQSNPIYQYTNVPGYPHTYKDDFQPYVASPATFQGQNSSMMYYNSYDFSNINFASPMIYNPVSDTSLNFTQAISL